MIRQIFSTALTTALLAGTASAATFNFSQQGYDGGGVFSGFFEGEDLNNDGQIVSFDNEVTNLVATFQGVGRDGSNIFANFDFESLQGETGNLTGLVLILDGGGTIGDSDLGASEGLALDNGEHYIAVGPGPNQLCDGSAECGVITLSENGGFFFDGELGPIDSELGPIALDLGPLDDDEPFEGPFGEFLASSSEVINVTTGPIGDPLVLGSPTNPFLPTQDPDENGGFIFEITEDQITPFQTFFIDPEIAVGYTYTVTGSTFHSVTAPTLGQVADGDGQYMLTANGVMQVLLAGDTYIFGAGTNITEFTITGIDVMPGLDPNDPLAFETGVSVSSFTGSVVITQTPITENTSAVPLPASFLLIGSGLAALGATRRRRRKS